MLETVTLKTKCGDVIGRKETEGYIFEGIPFATAERFKEPVPVNDFEGSFDATKKPLEFIQDSAYLDLSDRFYTKEFRDGETFEYAESPLTLNIMTPKNAKNCPVLIYIHGGAFVNGKLSELPQGTSFEYAKRGIILVSIGYRLNVFGLYRSRNFYLYDQICAIKWVKKNIESYGGNSEDISLIGHSAGAMSIFQLLSTDCLKGIVKRVIMMSGAGFFPGFTNGYREEKSAPFWDKIMHAAGCNTEEEMAKVDAEKLWHAWHGVNIKNYNPHLMMPGIDGKIIPGVPSEIKKSGNMLDVPMIIGVTSQDMYFPIKIFNMAKSYAVWSCKQHRSNVYLYYFDHTLPGHGYKAFHGADLWYMFGNMDKSKKGFLPEDEKLKDTMAGCVERFIKEGNPGWEAFSLKNKVFRRFDTKGPEFVKGKDCYLDLLKYSLFDRGPF